MEFSRYVIRAIASDQSLCLLNVSLCQCIHINIYEMCKFDDQFADVGYVLVPRHVIRIEDRSSD